jgi:hypothetical protein
MMVMIMMMIIIIIIIIIMKTANIHEGPSNSKMYYENQKFKKKKIFHT